MPQAAAAVAVGINAASCRKGVCGELGVATGAVEQQLMGTVNVDKLRRDQRVQLSHAARFNSVLVRTISFRRAATGTGRLTTASGTGSTVGAQRPAVVFKIDVSGGEREKFER